MYAYCFFCLLQGLCKPGRAVVTWMGTQNPELFRPDNFPVFIFQDSVTGLSYYGFPEMFGEAGE